MSGQIYFTWELRDQITNQEVGCIAGESVRVTLANVSTTFSCQSGSGTSSAVPDGYYAATFELIDTAGAVESSTTINVRVHGGAVSDAGHVVFQLASGVGSMQFTWSLEHQSTGTPLGCQQTEVVRIEIAGFAPQDFNCTDYGATIPNLPADTYSVVARLYNGPTLESELAPISIPVTAGGTTQQAIVFQVTSR